MKVRLMGLLSKEYRTIKNLKKATLIIISKGLNRFETKINEEQELLMNISEMVIETYVAESTVLRTLKLIDQSGAASAELFMNFTNSIYTTQLESQKIHIMKR